MTDMFREALGNIFLCSICFFVVSVVLFFVISLICWLVSQIKKFFRKSKEKEFEFCKSDSKYLLQDGTGVYLHFLKIHPCYFRDVKKGIKTFEVRFNDRDYHVGDYLCLREYENGEYTGRELRKQVCYVFCSDEYCKKGFVILGLE